MSEPRVVVWYSDGAASAVAASLALEKYDRERVHVVKCDTTEDEHPDNYRFRADVERWLGIKVELVRSSKYLNVDDVFERTRYMAGISGARCTTELKKAVRWEYQRDDDIHVFGYTVEEQHRAKMFQDNHVELTCDWLLIDQFVTKKECHNRIRGAGIKTPAMYRLGFDHNNCLGCVKATSPGYWNRIRRHFPEAFDARSTRSRDLGVRLVQVQGERVFLDELDPSYGLDVGDGDIECGPFCDMGLGLE